MNLVVISGTILEAKLAYTQTGLAVNRVNLAGQDLDNKKFYTNVTFFGKPAEELANATGKHIALQGRLKQDEWVDKNGETRSSLNIIGNRYNWIDDGNVKLSDPDSRGQSVLTNAFNEVIVQGNLTREIENREVSNGNIAANGTVAHNARKLENGKWVDGDTSFIRFTMWTSTPVMSEKGAPVIVKGKFEARTHEGKRYEQVVGRVIVLTRRERIDSINVPPPTPERPSMELGDEFPPEEDLPF